MRRDTFPFQCESGLSLPEQWHASASFFLLPSDFSASLTRYTSMLSQQQKNGKRSGYANQGFLVYSKSRKSEPLHAKIGKSKNPPYGR